MTEAQRTHRLQRTMRRLQAVEAGVDLCQRRLAARGELTVMCGTTANHHRYVWARIELAEALRELRACNAKLQALRDGA